VPIEPIRVMVRRGYLFNMEDHLLEWEEGKIVALSSYPGSVLTTQVLLDSRGLFSDLPLHALTTKKSAARYGVRQVYYSNCPGPEVTVFKLPLERGTIFLRNNEGMVNAKYLLSLDWYNNNEQMHLLTDEEGNFWLHPNHKILWGQGIEGLPKYKKLRTTWSYPTGSSGSTTT
jgi:hypothetical protein